MKKRGWFISLIVISLVFLSFVTASSIDSEIKRITSYAEDYETGNINYAQLMINLGSTKQKINELLGATEKEHGGILKQEQLKSLLGEPTEETKWIWVENEEREKKLETAVPAWRKIIFDGKNIQLWLNSWPSLFKKGDEETLVYRLNLEVRFKQTQEFNINEKILHIKNLAEQYNSNPSQENGNILAKESVNAERLFGMFMQQNQGKCEDIMKSVFGSENKRTEQKMLVQEIDFYSSDKFDAIARLEMCDECEWNWIGVDVRIDTRGKFKLPESSQGTPIPTQTENFESAIRSIIEELKKALEEKNYDTFLFLKNKLQAYNEQWNRKSNDIWQEVDKLFEAEMKASQEKQQEEYYWIKLEQRKREKERELRKQNYEKRKQFYLSLFSGYEKKEFYFSQQEFEKRLIEEFKEFGKEICNNNKDDNNNEKVDCDDEQCAGKICGKQKVKIQESNETGEIEKELYCIAKTCQLKEEIIEKKEIVCGNHICEENETLSCKEDCIKCENYSAIECSGKVIFKGLDENNCPLEPICLNETLSCISNEDCLQPLCGIAECIERVCKTTKLEECKEAECKEGEEKIKNCDNREKIVFEKCIEGVWKKTNADCIISENKTETESCEKECSTRVYPTCVGHLEISGSYPNCNCNWICEITENQCQVKEDCGNPDDVCSNGKCVTLPQAIKLPETPQPQEPTETAPETTQPPTQEQPEQPIQSEQEQQPQAAQQAPEQQTITAQIIKTIKTITGKITGFIISGFEVQEQPAESVTTEPTQLPQETQPPTQEPAQEPPPQEDLTREREMREQEDRRRENERQDNCQKMCNDECKRALITPCVEKCTRDSDCKDTKCIDEEIKNCENKCQGKNNIDSCIKECFEKCVQGQEFHKERQEEEQKMEKGVFKVGGACRTAQGQQRTESFIFFDGWGEPFQNIQYLKQKYYSGGESDWCKQDLDSLYKQRKEFEKSFNQEFVRWFFEKYLANSAEDWEQQVSGIFELYWKNVDILRETAFRLQCLNKKEPGYTPIEKISYETEYGKIEFWEELKTAKFPGIEEEMPIITPYMKIWVFPPKSFIIYEMKKGMKNHEFPGPPEEKLERGNEEGPTAEEREIIKQDKKFMKQIKEISEAYEGNLDAAIRFVDNGTVVFNLYAQVNENDIIKIKPMLPEEVPQEDVRIEIDFKELYDLIYTSEKEMRGEYIESPPWARKPNPIGKIKEVASGIKMYFKVRSMINSAKISPKEAEKETRKIMKLFFSMMKKAEKQMPEMQEENIGEEKGVWEKKEKITGEIIKAD